jgi:hypothetical protein
MANRIPDEMYWDEAIGVIEVLVATGRAIPSNRWVDVFIQDAQDRKEQSYF